MKAEVYKTEVTSALASVNAEQAATISSGMSPGERNAEVIWHWSGRAYAGQTTVAPTDATQFPGSGHETSGSQMWAGNFWPHQVPTRQQLALAPQTGTYPAYNDNSECNNWRDGLLVKAGDFVNAAVLEIRLSGVWVITSSAPGAQFCEVTLEWDADPGAAVGDPDNALSTVIAFQGPSIAVPVSTENYPFMFTIRGQANGRQISTGRYFQYWDCHMLVHEAYPGSGTTSSINANPRINTYRGMVKQIPESTFNFRERCGLLNIRIKSDGVANIGLATHGAGTNGGALAGAQGNSQIQLQGGIGILYKGAQ